jgi:hypothetical protein
MKLKIKKLFLAAILTTACALAFGQASKELREKNLEQVLSLVQQNPGKPGVLLVDQFVKTLPRDELYALEIDFWEHQYKAKQITRLEYANRMLESNREFASGDRITIDYWRYIIMLATKAEKGTLPEEEYRYLADKKFDEAQASLKAQSDAENSAEQQSRYAERMRRAQQAQEESFNTGEFLQSIGRSFRPRNPTTFCDTTKTPLGMQTTCR